MKVKERCSTHLISSRDPLWIPYQLRVARLEVSEQPAVRCLEKASSRQPPVDPSSTSTLDLCWMLPSASVLACRRKERVQKAVSVVHHERGDAGVSAVLDPLSHAECDYVTQIRAQSHWVQAHRRRDDAARARLRRTLHLPRVRVEGKGTPGIGGEGGARAGPEPPPCPLLLRARRRWRGMRFGCCAPGIGERIDHSECRADRRSGFRSAEGASLGRTAAVWSSGEPFS